MKTFQTLTVLFLAVLMATPAFAQPASPAAPAAMSSSDAKPAAAFAPATATQTAPGQMSAADMQKMMATMAELAKLNENHKMLGELAGNWNYTVRMWMNPDPSAKPEEYKGTAVRKSMMDGRFYVLDVTGKMKMPGPDGKPKDVTFKGMGLEGYDNVKKKFIGTWMDNMGTSIMMSEGDYDPATKALTYTGEYEAIPGMKTKIREVVKVVDKDHHTFEWYEDRGGKEAKTMEISYTRAKK